MPRRRARTDATAKDLTQLARELGALYLPLNAAVDGVLQLRGGRQVLVDWKSPGGSLTDTQAKLVASGWKIEFIQTEDQLKALLGVEGR